MDGLIYLATEPASFGYDWNFSPPVAERCLVRLVNSVVGKITYTLRASGD
jgi:hypothetical protein